MKRFRIALANIQHPSTPEESVLLAEQAFAQSSVEHADLSCFPECFGQSGSYQDERVQTG
jgi:predicted amidohydrolase